MTEKDLHAFSVGRNKRFADIDEFIIEYLEASKEKGTKTAVVDDLEGIIEHLDKKCDAREALLKISKAFEKEGITVIITTSNPAVMEEMPMEGHIHLTPFCKLHRAKYYIREPRAESSPKALYVKYELENPGCKDCIKALKNLNETIQSENKKRNVKTIFVGEEAAKTQK